MNNIQDTIAWIAEADDESLRCMSMNKVADSYRSNSVSLITLLPLLRSERVRVVQCGAWLASEIVDVMRGREVFDDLSKLLLHPDDEVRFLSIEGVSLLVRPTDTEVLVRLIELLSDRDHSVQFRALRWCCLIPDHTFKGLSLSRFKQDGSLLLNSVLQVDILAALRSASMTSRRLAIAGALRHFGRDDSFIESLYPSLDEDEQKLLSTLPKCFAYR